MSKPVIVAPRSGVRDYRKGRAIGGGTTGGKEVVAAFGKDHIV